VFDMSDSQITQKDFEPIKELIPTQVQSVSPLILKHLKVGDYLLQIRAAPLDDFKSVHSLSLMQGDWPSENHQVVIGEGTVATTHWKVGQSIRIYGVDFTVTGIVRSPGTKFGSIWMTLGTAEKLFGTHGVYQFAWIVLAPGADAIQVMTRLSNDPRLAGKVEVYYADQLYQQYSNAMNDSKDIGSMLVALSLISVMLGVYGSTYLTLTERSRELTILRSVGFETTVIRLILSLRTFIQVITAYLLSWGITYLAIQGFQKVTPLMIHSIPLPVVISMKSLGIGAVLSLLFAWIGVWLPTRHLHKTSVANMITR
jgi:ABC-type antimicrobial peptide transport system permease subunit